jgi:hypothetical protein
VLDRAEQARKAGSRLWRADEAAREALDILRGASIKVDLNDTPVLHRRLLAGPRNTAIVSPEMLLHTMGTAFDRARDDISRIADAAARTTALRSRIAQSMATLPAQESFAARLAAADVPDALDRLEALEALATDIDAALTAIERARMGLDAARRDLTTLQDETAKAETVFADCHAAITCAAPGPDTAAVRELAAWLDRIGGTLAAGRTEAVMIGLANWQAQRAQTQAAIRAVADAAAARLGRLADVRARLPALRAKHRARTRPDVALDLLAATAKATLDTNPVDLDEAARALGAYQAGLAQP